MDGWIEIKNCVFCGSELRPYKSVASAPAVIIEFINGSMPMLASSTYSKCTFCGLVVQSPRMTDERISYYYSSGIYRDTLGMPVEAMDADEQRRALDVAKWLDLTPQSHLDIGASRGYLLEAVGAVVKHGYDSNPSYSKGVRVFRDKQELGKYDLVTSIHCLEHVTDPVKELEWYRSLTEKLLCVEVPGESTPGGALRFAHLYYFPPDVLVSMIRSIGMKVIKIDTEPNTRVLCTL